MSTTLAIHWDETEIQSVVVRHGQVQAASSVALASGQDASAVGLRLAEALAPYSLGKAKTVVAVGRREVDWQLLSLPPCPAEELADLVRLQADHELSDPDEEAGFDFFALAGDSQTPYQVLTVSLASEELTKIRQVCRAADLALERIVPLAVGWPLLTSQVASDDGTQIFVAPLAREATLWATRSGKVTLFRQLQLSESDDPTALAASMNNELRRTLLALSQQASAGTTTISLVGMQQEKLTVLAEMLESQFGMTAQPVDLPKQLLLSEAGSTPFVLPLSGLAIAEAGGTRPLVDLLHPRRRPASQTGVRTYALAGAAALSLALLLGWQGYSNLKAPLEKATEDQAELTLLEEPLDDLKKHVQRAGAIRDWNAEVANVLLHLEQVSQKLRPTELDAEDFPTDQDIVLDKLVLEKRRLTLDALARSNEAVQPLEARLREGGYRPQRGKSEPSKTLEDYPWHFKSTIEITDASDSATGSEPPAGEPQS